jgi:predicted amidophosphoribosyltransferase
MNINDDKAKYETIAGRNVRVSGKVLHKLEDKEKTEPDTICVGCEKPVDAWDQYAEDYGEGGMLIWKICPHCGESNNPKDGAWTFIVIFLFFIFMYALSQMENV